MPNFTLSDSVGSCTGRIALLYLANRFCCNLDSPDCCIVDFPENYDMIRMIKNFVNIRSDRSTDTYAKNHQKII